jgi:hypothetical protein
LHGEDLPACRPEVSILNAHPQPIQHSSTPSFDGGLSDGAADSQHSDVPMISDYDGESDIPADSEYESSSAYDAVSIMDTDDDPIHVTSKSANQRITTETPKEQFLNNKLSAGLNRSSMTASRFFNRLGNTKKLGPAASSPLPNLSGTDTGAGPSEQPRGSHKVFDLFSNTKRLAAEAANKVKRKLASDDEDNRSGAKTESKSHKKRPRTVPSNNSESGTHVGISKSAIAFRLLNQQVVAGTFIKHPLRWPRFVKSIQELDKDAEFDIDGDPHRVRHSICLRSLKMTELYNIATFKKHVDRQCSGPTKAVLQIMPPKGTPTLLSMATAGNWNKTELKPQVPLENIPCPGLNSDNIPSFLQQGFEVYLLRTPMAGGGGPTTDELTGILFPDRQFTSLSLRQKNEVRSAQRQRHRWHNHADLQKIFSADCCKTVCTRRETQPTPACSACMALVMDKNFKHALSRPLPSDANRKYTPKILIDKAAVDQWGRVSGLKALIDANDKVSKSMTQIHICNSFDNY